MTSLRSARSSFFDFFHRGRPISTSACLEIENQTQQKRTHPEWLAAEGVDAAEVVRREGGGLLKRRRCGRAGGHIPLRVHSNEATSAERRLKARHRDKKSDIVAIIDNTRKSQRISRKISNSDVISQIFEKFVNLRREKPRLGFTKPFGNQSAGQTELIRCRRGGTPARTRQRRSSGKTDFPEIARKNRTRPEKAAEIIGPANVSIDNYVHGQNLMRKTWRKTRNTGAR